MLTHKTSSPLEEMADLETMYGEDAAQALYMWRFAGVSFGLEARFWWALLGSLATASLTALREARCRNQSFA